MSKKEYNAREVAIAILKKAEQTFKNSKLHKTDPQNMNGAQAAGLKGIKLPSTPHAAEKPEMKPPTPPQPQMAAKMPKPLKNFMAKRMEKAEMAKGNMEDVLKENANPTVRVGREVKDGKMVGHLYEHSLAGAKVRRGDIKGAKETMKDKVAQVKAQPKPNLTKKQKG